MNKSIYRKSLDLQKQGVQFVIRVTQNDTLTRQIIISIVDGGKPFDLTNARAVFYAQKPSGNILYNACTIIDNTVVYVFTEQTLAESGVLTAQIKLYGATDDGKYQILSIPRFAIEIDDELNVDSAIESTNEYTALTTAVAETNEVLLDAAELVDKIELSLINGEFIGPQGVPGEQGPQGEPGPQGEQGPAGAKGQDGAQGADGKSAYEIALANGFEGSETTWLESLKGESGGVVSVSVNGGDIALPDEGGNVNVPVDFTKLLNSPYSFISTAGIKKPDIFTETGIYLSLTTWKLSIPLASGGARMLTMNPGSTILFDAEGEAFTVVCTDSLYYYSSNGDGTWLGGFFTTEDDVIYTIQQNVYSFTKITENSISAADLSEGIYTLTFTRGVTVVVNINGTDTSYSGLKKGTIIIKSADNNFIVLGTMCLIFEYDNTNQCYKDPVNLLANVLAQDGDNSTPDYWAEALMTGADAIKQAVEAAGYNKSAFLFYSDAHWDYNSEKSPSLLKYLAAHTPINKTFFGGDVVNTEADVNTEYGQATMDYLWDWRHKIKDLPNHHSVVGNHDDGNATNNLFSESYVYSYLQAPEETPHIVRGNKGLYYYLDWNPEKTRYLFLDTAYRGVDSAQQEFVENALLTTPADWHIVAVAHIWHDTIYNDDGSTEVGDISSNASILLGMFDNYNSRIGAYADCSGWVEFCIGGHTHVDYDSTSSTGIPVILVETDSKHVRSGLNYEEGTTTESSVNGIIADYDNHIINVIRIGRGASRTIEVTNYVINYTNQIPISLDADGVSVYNGIGYKENTRWSSSGNHETTGDGIYITGYIPVEDLSVIRLKNITMNINETDDRKCTVLLYTDFESCFGSNKLTDINKYHAGVTDDNGNYIQLIPDPEGKNSIKYIRLQASYIGPDSIVTVDEPIE